MQVVILRVMIFLGDREWRHCQVNLPNTGPACSELPGSKTRIVTFLLLFGFFLLPRPLAGQVWEAGIQWVSIDYRPWGRYSDKGEKLPNAYGVWLAHTVPTLPLFVEGELSYGMRSLHGETCFFDPSDPEAGGSCTNEEIDYSNGLFLASVGWTGVQYRTPFGAVGFRPKVGLGAIRAHKEGRETGPNSPDSQALLSASGAIVVMVPVGDPGITLTAFAEGSILHPLLSDTGCDDCTVPFRGSMPSVSIGIGIRWSGGS